MLWAKYDAEIPTEPYVEWKRNLVAHGDAREEKWRGKRRMEWVAKQALVWLGTVHPVLLQSFSPDPHSKKASTRLNWHPRRYKWNRPFRWKTESGFCACAITFRLHSTTWLLYNSVQFLWIFKLWIRKFLARHFDRFYRQTTSMALLCCPKHRYFLTSLWWQNIFVKRCHLA